MVELINSSQAEHKSDFYIVSSTWEFVSKIGYTIKHFESESEQLLIPIWLCNPTDYTVHGILQARLLEWVAVSSPGTLPNPGIEPRPPALQADSLPSEPPRKPKNTGVDSLSLLQGIFPTQELNQSFLHCRWIPYQLSYHFTSIYIP